MEISICNVNEVSVKVLYRSPAITSNLKPLGPMIRRQRSNEFTSDMNQFFVARRSFGRTSWKHSGGDSCIMCCCVLISD
jgi:hypothetical protein